MRADGDERADAFVCEITDLIDLGGWPEDSGLCRFLFSDLDANWARLGLVCMAADLVCWFQLLCCDGELAAAEPKRLRWTLWHTPARVVRKAGRDIVRILDGWPTTRDLTDAYQHIAART